MRFIGETERGWLIVRCNLSKGRSNWFVTNCFLTVCEYAQSIINHEHALPRVLTSGIQCNVVHWKSTSVSEEHVTSIFRIKE
jgi:tRNA G37 N-methylase TrmD